MLVGRLRKRELFQEYYITMIIFIYFLFIYLLLFYLLFFYHIKNTCYYYYSFKKKKFFFINYFHNYIFTNFICRNTKIN